MPAIFFNISDKQSAELRELMEEEGYSGKAEFIRFLIKFFKYNRQRREFARLEQSTEELANVLRQLDKKGKLGRSVDEQLSDV